MSAVKKPSRTHLWAESLGDWSWPGEGGAVAAEALPPSWVPAFPPRRESAAALPVGSTSREAARRRALLLAAVLLSALLSTGVALALRGRLSLGELVHMGSSEPVAQLRVSQGEPSPLPVAPTLTQVSEDAAGSSIETASYHSAALHRTGSFLTYLPPGYASTNAHYPVMYMLTGTDQRNSDFLRIGVQGELDHLIAKHEIPPLIAVMIQGGPGSNLWRNRYERYVLEVQELIDRMLPTVRARGARAVVGDSMGGYGAMHTVLSNPYRFGVVESWLGFFNGLGPQLHAAEPIFKRLGLHAFVYGGHSDKIADPAENPAFAASLRAAGADAKSAVYSGEHNLSTLEAHLSSTLRFAGRALGSAASASKRHSAS
jgi:enterochelin esterase-like enzyme